MLKMIIGTNRSVYIYICMYVDDIVNSIVFFFFFLFSYPLFHLTMTIYLRSCRCHHTFKTIRMKKHTKSYCTTESELSKCLLWQDKNHEGVTIIERLLYSEPRKLFLFLVLLIRGRPCSLLFPTLLVIKT